jgi:hypothetical protein
LSAMPFAPRQRGSPVRWRYSGRSNPTNALRRSAATLGATLTADDMRSGRWLDDATRLDGGMQRDGTVRIQRQIQSLGLRLRTAIHAAARGVNLLMRALRELHVCVLVGRWHEYWWRGHSRVSDPAPPVTRAIFCVCAFMSKILRCL